MLFNVRQNEYNLYVCPNITAVSIVPILHL